MRAKPRPTVSTPLRWAEVEDAVDRGQADALVFDIDDVPERVADYGDLFEAVLTTRQELRPT